MERKFTFALTTMEMDGRWVQSIQLRDARTNALIDTVPYDEAAEAMMAARRSAPAMTAMRSVFEWYFPIEEDPRRPAARQVQADEIMSAAATHGLEAHREDHQGITTIQVETSDKQKAILFKLACGESAVHDRARDEGHYRLTAERFRSGP